MKRFAIPVFFVAVLLVACAGTNYRRNSAPGLSVTDKKIVVAVQEDAHNADYTTKLDSIWKNYAGKSRLDVDYVYVEPLALEPFDRDKALAKCVDSYIMTIGVSGKSSSQMMNGQGMVVSGSSSVEYTAVMYDCNTMKVVWKMVLETTGMAAWAQSELVKSIFKDFKENNILKE